MRTISSTLKQAAKEKIQFPVARVYYQATRMEQPTLFAGSESGDSYFRFDFTKVEGTDWYLRVRYNSTSGEVEYQRITNVHDASQWTTWTTVAGASPTTGSAVACSSYYNATYGYEIVDIYWFQVYAGDGLTYVYYSRSFDGGIAWDAPVRIALAQTGIVDTLASCFGEDRNIVFAKGYSGSKFRPVIVFYHNGSWARRFAPWYLGWQLDEIEDGVTAVAIERGKRWLVISACPWYEEQNPGSPEYFYSTHPSYFHYVLPESSFTLIEPIIRLDEKPVAGKPQPEKHHACKLSEVNGRYFCSIKSTFVERSDYVGTTTINWYATSPDGVHWNTDSRNRIIAADGMQTGWKCFVKDGYFWEVGWSAVHRRSATWLVGEDNWSQISGEVKSFTINWPRGAEADSCSLELSDIPDVSVNDRIRVDVGYKTSAGKEYVTVFDGSIDTISQHFSPEERKVSIQLRSHVKDLKQNSSRPTVYLSQMRFFKDFTDDSDFDYFVRRADSGTTWTDDETNDLLRFESTTGAGKGVALAGVYDVASFYALVKFRWSSTNEKVGLVFRAQDASAERCFAVYYQASDDTVRCGYFYDWTTFYQTAYFTVGEGWTTDTWESMLVICRDGYWYVYTTTAAGTLVHKLTPTVFVNQDALLDGHIGLFGEVSSTNKVEFDKILVGSFRTDNTLQDIVKDISVRGGIESVDVGYDLFDDFSAATIDTTLWPSREGTWTIEDGKLKATVSTGSARIFSSKSYRNVLVRFKMKLVGTDGIRGGAILRADTAAQDWYQVEILLEATGDVWVEVAKVDAGSKTYLPYSIELFHWGILEDVEYEFTVSHQDNFISIWCGDILLRIAHDDWKTTSGNFGFFAEGTGSVYFDDVQIEELYSVYPLFTHDAGVAFADAIRALMEVEQAQTRVVDRTLKVWKQESTEIVATFGEEIFSCQLTDSDLEWVSLVRVTGEAAFATAFDLEKLISLGWRPHFESASEVESSEKCFDLAESVLESRQRARSQLSLSVPAQLACEVGDRIEVAWIEFPKRDAPFIIRSASLSFKKEPPSLVMNISAEEA